MNFPRDVLMSGDNTRKSEYILLPITLGFNLNFSINLKTMFTGKNEIMIEFL